MYPLSNRLHKLITRSVPADLPWPAQSPGLNPIENVWRIVKPGIAKKPIANGVVGLQQQVENAWDSIPLHTIQTLIDSMPRRIAEVVGAKHRHIRY